MRELFFVIEDNDVKIIVDEWYMNYEFDNVNQKLLFVGTAEDVDNYLDGKLINY